MSPPAGGDEHLDPGRAERRRGRRAEQQPGHAGVGPRRHAAGRRDAHHRVESRQEREGQGEGQGQALRPVQEEAVDAPPRALVKLTHRI